ncbi:hypothetical protein ACJMK2_005543 [Sinanodonta woodiana]|uniref:Uncharacterized protein n=1 Tax=Sinanodonta woodiana TaxID=1069815 RepID=A0ABD3VT47_SINWO
MESLDPSDDVAECDLGLGHGLRPGGLLPGLTSDKETELSLSQAETGNVTREDTVDYFDSYSESFESSSEDEIQISLHQLVSSHYKRPSIEDELSYASDDDAERSDTASSRNQNTQNMSASCSEEQFPMYADVPYGTSIKQQKRLFNQSLNNIVKKHSSRKSTPSVQSEGSYKKKYYNEALKIKLMESLQEVSELKTELEVCRKKLNSKYEAIEIMRKQAEDAQIELVIQRKKSQENTVKLVQSQICYSGEGERKGTSSCFSALVVGDERQGTNPPASTMHQAKPQCNKKSAVSRDNYTRVCRENATLMATLEKKNEELKKLTAQKIALSRENDEILALLDVQERAKYEGSRSVSSSENYCTFSSTELAILGACRCRVREPDPCGCAHAAANLKKEITRLKDEIQVYKRRRDEAFLTVDAYRKAFDEQLQQNKTLTLQIANMLSSNPSKSAKVKSAFKWLIRALNDQEENEEEDLSRPICDGPQVDYPPQVHDAGTGSLTEKEIISHLTELLHEKKELIAHQKLAAQILGEQVKDLESKLAQNQYEDVF